MLRFMRLHSVYSASFYTDYISVRAVFPLQKLHIHRLKLAVIRYAHYILNRMYCQCPQSAKLSRQKGGKPIFPNCFGIGCRLFSVVGFNASRIQPFGLIPHTSAFSPMPSI